MTHHDKNAPLPKHMDGDLLRQIADWFDTYDLLAERYIDLTADAVSAERAEELRAIVTGKGVQNDLRRWADQMDRGAWLYVGPGKDAGGKEDVDA